MPELGAHRLDFLAESRLWAGVIEHQDVDLRFLGAIRAAERRQEKTTLRPL